MPAHFGEIRPCGLTLVISHITSPAQPSDMLPRCIRCQSFAEPLLELYWHIGETTTRLGSVSPRSVIGENRTLAISADPLGAKTMIEGLQYHDFRGRVHVPDPVRSGADCNLKRFNRSQSLGYPGGDDMG